MDTIQGAVLSKAASAYEHLRRLATHGRLRPDRRLSPPDLANELRISVTPVRDALARLAAEGFIRGKDGRGYFTQTYTIEEQRDLYHLLLTLCVAALDLARQREQAISLAALACLEAAQAPDASSHAIAAARFADATDELVARVADASGSTALPGTLRNLLDRTRYIRELDAWSPTQRVAKATVMRALADAIAADNLTGTIGLVRNHLAEREKRLADVVEEANRVTGALKFP
jgi:DNA-binding GntR family transcriptional regulator